MRLSTHHWGTRTTTVVFQSACTITTKRFKIIDKKGFNPLDYDDKNPPAPNFQSQDLLDKETKKLIDEHFQTSIRETEAKLKQMEKSAIYNAFLREFKELEGRMWAKFRESKVPVKPQSIQYVRDQLEERRKALELKYKHISRLVGDQIKATDQSRQSLEQQAKSEQDQEKRKAYDHLLKNLNTNQDDIVNDPMFGALKKVFEQATGQEISHSDLTRQVTQDDIDQLMKNLDGPQGKEIEERINSILSDKKLREMGIDPNEFNPNGITDQPKKFYASQNNNNSSDPQKQQQNKNQPNFDVSGPKINNLKYMIQKEMEANPGLAKFLLEETGTSFETMFDQFEHDLKDGSLYANLTNAERVMMANTLSELLPNKKK